MTDRDRDLRARGRMTRRRWVAVLAVVGVLWVFGSAWWAGRPLDTDGLVEVRFPEDAVFEALDAALRARQGGVWIREYTPFEWETVTMLARDITGADVRSALGVGFRDHDEYYVRERLFVFCGQGEVLSVIPVPEFVSSYENYPATFSAKTTIVEYSLVDLEDPVPACS